MSNCHICNRLLNNPNDPYSRDCGGDCLDCMARVGDDPDCIRSIAEIHLIEKQIMEIMGPVDVLYNSQGPQMIVKLKEDMRQAIAWGSPDNESTGLSASEFISLLSRALKAIEDLESSAKIMRQVR